jgi:hypothetical protein
MTSSVEVFCGTYPTRPSRLEPIRDLDSATTSVHAVRPTNASTRIGLAETRVGAATRISTPTDAIPAKRETEHLADDRFGVSSTTERDAASATVRNAESGGC